MTVCAHWMPQSLRSWAIVVGFVLLPAIVIAAEGVEMSAEGVNKEVQVSDGIAPTISLLNKCGRPDLSKSFIEQQDKFLLVCGATHRQNRVSRARLVERCQKLLLRHLELLPTSWLIMHSSHQTKPPQMGGSLRRFHVANERRRRSRIPS